MLRSYRIQLCILLILVGMGITSPTPIVKAEMPLPQESLPVRQEARSPSLTGDELINAYISDVCDDYDVDPLLVQSVIAKESSYDPTAIGDGGRSIGLMQIQPRWHSKRAASLGVDDISDPYGNILVGVDYLDDLLKLYDPALALMIYNAGPRKASEMRAKGITSDYARTILQNTAKLQTGGI